MMQGVIADFPGLPVGLVPRQGFAKDFAEPATSPDHGPQVRQKADRTRYSVRILALQFSYLYCPRNTSHGTVPSHQDTRKFSREPLARAAPRSSDAVRARQ